MSVRGWSTEWFLTLCELGSMSATADALGIPQSTLSRRLQRLEHDVGTQLFDRAAGGLRINNRGEVLREHLGRADAEVVAGGRGRAPDQRPGPRHHPLRFPTLS